jgi:hypothetical protein
MVIPNLMPTCPLMKALKTWQLATNQLTELRPMNYLTKSTLMRRNLGTTRHNLRDRWEGVPENDCVFKAYHKSAHIPDQSLPSVYPPLKLELSTRVFELFPGKEDDPVRGRLKEIDLNKIDPKYTALSYAWGGNQTLHTVECDGRQVPVTCNLYSALIRHRRQSSKLPIFVDALCINQFKDPISSREREAQVQLMKTIYSMADEVVVDLGDEADNSNAAVRLLEAFCKISDEDWDSLLQGSVKADQLGIPGFDDSAWHGFSSLCSRNWFQRTWVVQEFALAKNLLIRVGDRSQPPEILTKGVYRATFFSSFSGPETLPKYYAKKSKIELEQVLCAAIHHRARALILLGKIHFLNTVREGSQDENPEGFSLGRLLYSTKSLLVTKRHDRVYALLGLCRDEDISALRVNYSEPVENLSQLVTNHLIAGQELFLVLYHLASFNRTHTPSWMIDFNIDRRSDILEQMAGVSWQVPASQGSPFCACGNEPVQFSQESDKHIKVRGHRLGRICWVSNTFSAKAGRENINPQNFYDWYHETRRGILAHTRGQEEEVMRTYMSTLVAGGKLQLVGSQLSSISDKIDEYIDSFKEAESWWDKNGGKAQDARVEEWAAAGWPIKMVHYFKHLNQACAARRVCLTHEGLLGLVPDDAEIDDEVAIFLGGPIPFVLRKREGDFRLIGTAYIDGVMNGEALHWDNWGTEEIRVG